MQDDPPSYEQALVMVRAVAVVDEARLRCDAAVASTHHLIASDAAAAAGASNSVCSVSTTMNDHVVSASPPNYFEVQ